jgi:hypothetical protein
VRLTPTLVLILVLILVLDFPVHILIILGEVEGSLTISLLDIGPSAFEV